MADFINTIDALGDKVVADAIVSKTITEFLDDTVSIVGSNAFYKCYSLKNVNLPNVTDVAGSAFQYCTSLTNVSLPNATTLGGSVFRECSSLTSLDFPLVTSIGSYAFYYARNLKTIILRSSTVCTLENKNAFNSTPFYSGTSYTGGTILVPRSLVENYKTATNWSSVLSQNTKNRFLALEDYTVDGTITGAIDWDKLNGGTT